MKAKYFLFLGFFLSLGCAENPNKSDNANTESKSVWEKRTYNELYCEYADSLKRSGEEIFMDWDTTCKKVKIDIVQWNEQNELGKKINEFVLKSVVDDVSKFKTIEQWLKFNHKSSYSEEMSIDFSVKAENEKFVGIEFSQEWYGGGAHGAFFYSTVYFDRKDGHVIPFSEIIQDGKLNDFTKLAGRLFFKSMTSDDIDMMEMTKETFFLPDNFSLEKEGVKFIYQQYEIGAYALGLPEFIVPMSDCRNFIKPEFLQ